MKAMDRKLWRELWGMRMQAVAIAVVIAGGVSIFVMSLSTLDSLDQSRESYYRDYRFAQVFVSLKRAPASLLQRIQDIPGVDKVQARVVAYVNIDVPGFDDPVSGHLVSLSAGGRDYLNQVYLSEGRPIEPGRDDEVLLSKKFAEAHGLSAGDRIHATINGRRKALTVVGHASSPEFIHQIAPGAMFPDIERYGVFWMARKPLASAYDMEGAFNNLSLTLSRGGSEQDVIDRLDELLEGYGGTGAIARQDQLSHRFLSEELKQQRTVATVFPLIFFGVAAFLLNVVISRIVNLEREQIAALKAFGYSDLAVGLHYVKLVLLIVAVGAICGVGAGVWMGRALSNVYMELFSLPLMIYVLEPRVILAALTISTVVAVAGTLYSVRGAVRLPPAQAMRPEPPPVYRATLVERIGLQHWFTQPSRMILRNIERRPVKSMLTTLGLAMACGVMTVGGFQKSAIDRMVEIQYGMSQHEDLFVIYTEPTSARSLYSLLGLRGIEHVEGFRSVPVKLERSHRTYRTSLQGIQPGGSLMRLLDDQLEDIELPERGLVLTDYLAERLHVAPGEMLTVEVLEGNRTKVRVPVMATARQDLGMNAYMRLGALNRVLDEGDALTGALARVDERYQRDIYRQLKDMPRVAGVVEQKSAIRSFYENVAQQVLFYTFITTLLGGSIAFGVVYNSMRIALSERNRELASLRVLGFERGEVAYILLGEMALYTLLAIPLGLLIGYGLCGYLAYSFDTELYRIPLVLDRDVYALAALVIVVSALISAIMIWRNLGRLDMVAVLKTKE